MHKHNPSAAQASAIKEKIQPIVMLHLSEPKARCPKTPS